MSTNFSEGSISPSEWISQAEAAQLRGVSRQAISKLVRKKRLRSIVVGGHTLVSRADVLSFQPNPPGRPEKGTEPVSHLDRVKQLLAACAPVEREEVFRLLRQQCVLHPLETQLHAKAEIILEAIQRTGGLTLRMIRGVIAEAAFGIEVVERLAGWENVTRPGDHPYDFLLRDPTGDVRVQVKLQRSKEGRPMRASEAGRAFRTLPDDVYVVETQKTRGGKKKGTGSATRPYRFGEFDLLAVAMYPSTNRWDVFRYTVSNWLLPGRTDPAEVGKFQPVASTPDDDWTDSFETAVAWQRSGIEKRIRAG